METNKPKDLEGNVSTDFLGPINEMSAALAQRLETIPQVHKGLAIVQKKTGFSNQHIILCFMGFLLWLCFFFSGLSLIVSCVAWGYPLYRSVGAIEEKLDQEKWLMYWVVYALVGSFFHTFGDNVLFWIPMYTPLKLVVYLMLWHPAVNGAERIFERLISPYLNMALRGDKGL